MLAACALVNHARVAGASATPEPQATEHDGNKAEAKRHFLRGLEFARKDQNYDAALAEFLASRELFPTQVALLNAAISLTRLGRYDEALQMYAELFAAFGASMTPEERALANDEMADLQSRLGELELTVNEPGADVQVDGRDCGSTPLPAALRVAPGTHLVRVTKLGFEPFEGRVVVASQQKRSLRAVLKATPAPATLASPAPTRSGLLEKRKQPARSPRFHLTLGIGALVSPSLDGGAANSCNEVASLDAQLPGCRNRRRPLGPWPRLSVGYEVVAGLELDLSLGYTRVTERLTRSIVASGDRNRRYAATDYEDETTLSALTAALGVGHRFRWRTPVTLKLGVGLARVMLNHSNDGAFTISTTNPRDPTDVYVGSQRVQVPETELVAWLPLVAPEVRLGWQLTPRLSVDVGLGAVVMFGSSALRTGATSLSAEGERRTGLDDVPGGFADGSNVRPGVLALPAERRLGVFWAFTPSVGGRFEL